MCFGDLAGFDQDDLPAAFACLHASAAALAAGKDALRAALPAPQALHQVFRAALALGPVLDHASARRFFTTHFSPVRVTADGRDAFFTGYYEPLVDGSLSPGPAFTAPLLGRPDDLKTFSADEPRPDWATGLAAARVGRDGTSAPYPTRTEIENAIPSGPFRPVVWLRDWVEVFLIQVQGSARVRLPDGRLLSARYAGRNGHPYTSIGKILVEDGAIPADAMSLERLKAWLRDNGQEPGQRGRDVMGRNASYVFFEVEAAEADIGPIGGAGLPLTRLRSIAVDRSLWYYGLPFWVDARLPWQSDDLTPLRRLMIAQDTGSAITGPARADLFFGTGDEAGRSAGGIRHRGTFIVLRPNPGPGAAA